MKKILICLTIAWAIFLPKSHCAQDVILELGFKTTQKDIDYGQLSTENVFFDDCLEDLYEDDSNDSERKKLSSGTASYTQTSFVAHNFSANAFKTILPTKFFFPFRTSLYLFICVLRL